MLGIIFDERDSFPPHYSKRKKENQIHYEQTDERKDGRGVNIGMPAQNYLFKYHAINYLYGVIIRLFYSLTYIPRYSIHLPLGLEFLTDKDREIHTHFHLLY